MSQPNYIQRPPRIQPEMPHEEVEIPIPPSEEARASQNFIQLGLPLLTIIGYVFVSVFSQGRSLVFLLPMGISIVASVGLAIYSRIQEGKDKGKKAEAYAERLVELRNYMTVQHDMQRRFYRYNYPDSAETLAIAANASKAGSKLGGRLWERRTGDSDFTALRLGTGNRPSTVSFQIKQGGEFDAVSMRDALRLEEDSQFVSDVPITIPLRPIWGPDKASREPLESGRHAFGITGRNQASVYGFTRALLAHYVTFHPSTDAALHVLGSDQARSEWRWLAGLPHAEGGKNETICFERALDRVGDKEKNVVNTFLRNLRRILDERQLRLQDSDNNVDVTLPHIFVVIDMVTPPAADSMLRDLESDPGISLLMADGQNLGASIVFLVPDAQAVPGGCESVIEVSVSQISDDGQNNAEVNFRYAEVGINTPRYTGRADIIQEQDVMTQLVRHLEPLRVRKSYGADLPGGVMMMDMLRVNTSDELRAQTLENWQRNSTPEEADWLKVSLGNMSGGDIRTLKFSADADGVHGLIAGSTGSGKSELLMTMIIGMALRYDPSIVNFVLVDFKGGAAFEPFRKLPHCVDIVTNLRGSAVERMFAAITAELNRRQAINVATDSKHIVHYRQRSLHEAPYGSTVTMKGREYQTAPYPHLFVFIDEFAEMIAENPEYKAQLNSITRLGRALGVTLILAAQRPTGVTDQMRANIKFRIALRVETREESSEVLRRPDAAYLPTGIPGRGYLQVGNENIELIQVAWTGADYRGGQKVEKPNVIWHDRPRKAAGDAEEYPKVYEMMVDLMADMANQHSMPQRKPWPDFLPEVMSLQTPIDISYMNPEGLDLIVGDSEVIAGTNNTQVGELVTDETQVPLPLNAAINAWMNNEDVWSGVDWDEAAMRAVVGLIDNPYNSEQLPLTVDLRRGHAVIFGASGWGKTTFLRTLLVTLAATHSPLELHAYILDFGGRQLNVFRDLPHVGAIITPDEEERVQRLIRMLDEELERRKRLISDAGSDGLYSYNIANPAGALPAMLVMVDNFAEFRESFEGLIAPLISLVRESRAYGIHFAFSAETTTALSGKLYSLCTERMALKLSDATEYVGIVGRGARAIDDIPGRGFVKVEKRALEFQIALPIGSADDANMDETQKLAMLLRQMQLKGQQLSWTDAQKPTAVNTLATRVLLRNVLPESVERGGRVRPNLGIDDRSLTPWAFDLAKQGPHCIVVGPPNSGKTTALRSLVLSIASSYAPGEAMIVLADFQQRFYKYGGKHSLDDIPHVVDVLKSEEDLADFVTNLDYEVAQWEQADGRARPIFVVIDNYDSFSEDADRLRNVLPPLAVLARERGTDGLHFVIGGSPNILRASEGLRKQVQGPGFGLALTAEPVGSLNGRIPRALASAELPVGRGFAVKSGRTLMVQFATPVEDDDEPEVDLDNWIEAIVKRYPGERNTWQYAPPVDESEAAPADAVATSSANEVEKAASNQSASTSRPTQTRQQTMTTQTATPVATKPPAIVIPDGMSMDEIKRKLNEDCGLDKAFFDVLSEADILTMAVEMGVIQKA